MKTKKEKPLHPGISRVMEILRKNHLTGAQFTLLFDVSQPNAPANPLMNELQVYVENLVVTGWLQEDGTTLTDKGAALFVEIEKLFKAGKSLAPDIPVEVVKQLNETFPAIRAGSGKYLRCNEREVSSKLQWFRKNYPQYTWDTVLDATHRYVSDQEQENFKFTRRVKYFIAKTQQDKSVESELAEYCARIIAGDQEENNNNTFQEKVV